MVLCHYINAGSVVGIVKPCIMQKNLFELFAQQAAGKQNLWA